MPIELIEVKDAVSFYRIAKNANIILRADPILIIPFYRLTFYIDTRKLGEEELKRLFQNLSNKMVYIEGIKIVDTLKKFIEDRY